MAIDLLLAILHHLLIFLLAAVIASEFVMVRSGLSGRDLKRVGHIDGAYGGLAAAIIVIGVCRVIFGLKGWEFYVYNASFWAKIAAFLVVGVLSIQPTMRILRWRKAAEAAPDTYVVPEAEIASVRGFLRAEALIFLLIPVFAAMMARGVGLY